MFLIEKITICDLWKRCNVRRVGRYRRKKQKKILIIGSLSLLLFLCVGYAAFSTNLSITAKGNVKEKSRVIQSYDINSQTDFHEDYYKQNIVSVTFVNNADVPDNAIKSWNVSEDKKYGGVMAWIVSSSGDNTKYDLYIGAKGGVIANEYSGYLFYNFQNIKTINFENFDTRNATNMRAMFSECHNLTDLDVSRLNTSNVTEMTYMFNNCKNLTVLDVSKFNTSNVTSMGSMFQGCEKLVNLDLSNFNTSNVTNMSGMFYACRTLTTIDLSNFDTGKVTDMSFMFDMWDLENNQMGTSSLITIIFGDNFDTSKVTTMESMFLGCSKLINLDVSGFNTSNVTNMRTVFSQCASLKEVDLSNWNTSKVTIMQDMFMSTNFTTLDLSSFDTRNVTDMTQMFRNTSQLKTVYVGANWTTVNADTTNMFYASATSSVTRK